MYLLLMTAIKHRTEEPCTMVLTLMIDVVISFMTIGTRGIEQDIVTLVVGMIILNPATDAITDTEISGYADFGM